MLQIYQYMFSLTVDESTLDILVEETKTKVETMNNQIKIKEICPSMIEDRDLDKINVISFKSNSNWW